MWLFYFGGNLFDPNCEWVGFILNGNEIYSSNDLSFIGYISADDKFWAKRK